MGSINKSKLFTLLSSAVDKPRQHQDVSRKCQESNPGSWVRSANATSVLCQHGRGLMPFCHDLVLEQNFAATKEWISVSPLIDGNSHKMALSKSYTLKNILANFFDCGL